MTETRYIKVGYDQWVDIPTPQGPDIQVRQVGGAAPPTAVLVWRTKPSIAELEERGISREESDRASGPIRHPWPDVWSDYRRTFDRLKLAEDEARDLITSALHAAGILGVATDADAVADALKEFVALCQERRGEGADLPSELAAAVITLSAAANDDGEQRAAAVNLFGARGVRLHRVLAELRWRILDRG
jgi:hypothetical protein